MEPFPCPVCGLELIEHDPAECAELIDEAKMLELEHLLWEVV